MLSPQFHLATPAHQLSESLTQYGSPVGAVCWGPGLALSRVQCTPGPQETSSQTLTSHWTGGPCFLDTEATPLHCTIKETHSPISPTLRVSWAGVAPLLLGLPDARGHSSWSLGHPRKGPLCQLEGEEAAALCKGLSHILALSAFIPALGQGRCWAGWVSSPRSCALICTSQCFCFFFFQFQHSFLEFLKLFLLLSSSFS